MHQRLGIMVTTSDTMHHILGLTRAARAAGKKVDIFFTGDAVHMTRDPRFAELLGLTQVEICESSYIARGYQGQLVPGLSDKDFVTQSRNAELVEQSDRYLTL